MPRNTIQNKLDYRTSLLTRRRALYTILSSLVKNLVFAGPLL
jgi:hypothetical protein